MTIKENITMKADGHVDLDNRNYITLGLTYNEFLDLKSLIEDIVLNSSQGAASGNLWVNGFLVVERDARVALNLLKRLKKID